MPSKSTASKTASRSASKSQSASPARKQAAKSATPARKVAAKKPTVSRTVAAKPAASAPRKPSAKKAPARKGVGTAVAKKAPATSAARKTAAQKTPVTSRARKTAASRPPKIVVPAQAGAPQAEVVENTAMSVPAPTVSAPVAPQVGPVGATHSPGMVLLLTWVTLGIYGIWLHHKLNAEMRAFTPTVKVNPGWATVALFVPVAGLVSIVRTSGRVRQTQVAAGLPADCNGFVTFLAMLAGAAWAYQQSKLNEVWQHVQASR